MKDKVQRHFDGAVVPAFEVVRRDVEGRGVADIFVLTDCSETPYVTKDMAGGKWVIRIRANTQRRTARRAEVLSLCGRGQEKPVSAMQARLEFASKARWLIKIRNTGQTSIKGIEILGSCPFIDPVGWNFNQMVLAEVRPGEEDSVVFHASKRVACNESCRLIVRGKNEDEEPVETTFLLDPRAL